MDLQQDIWQQTSVHPSLKDGEIHVWRVNLDKESSSVQMLFETLSADEKQKAGKYRFEKDRSHFVVARGSLRNILGGYLNMSPPQIRFSYNRFGKPFLESESNQIRFNVSHSQGIALFALTREQEIGIDIEFINDNVEILKTAESVFSPTEISTLKTLPSNMQTAAFFCGWTRKEAFIKAVGEGFSYPTKQFTIPIKPEESDILLRTNVKNWSLMSLLSEHNFMAALAVEGKIKTVRYWQ